MADSEERLIRAFYDRFQAGLEFSTIIEARQFAGQVLQQPILSGTEAAKWMEQCI